MKVVKVKTFTWTKDSNKLFDYECSSLSRSNVVSADSLIIARKDSQIVFHDPKKGEVPAEHTPLCYLKKSSDGRFFLSSADLSTPLKLVIRSLSLKDKRNGHEIKVGDKIQIGRVEYLVREMRDENKNVVRADYGNLKKSKEMDIEDSQEADLCRICFEEETKDEKDVENKFVSPCSCKGSSKYVHVGCLKNWIKSKKQANKPSSGTGQHSLQSSLINLFRDLLGLSGLEISRPSPPMMSLSLNHYTYQAMPNYPARLVTPFHTHWNPLSQMTHHSHFIPNSLSMGNLVHMTHNEPDFRSVINDSGAPNMPQQLNNVHSHRAHSNSLRTNPTSTVENNCFSNFACDVCKDILPFTVKFNEETEVEMANITRPEDSPYLILERLSQGKAVKVFSVIKGVANIDVRLGRGHSCDIPISDISVSRFHAFIRYENGKFIIVDNNSKYGTLVILEDAIELQGDKLGFQSGRTLITISIKSDKILPNLELFEPEISTKMRRRKVNPNKRVQAKLKKTVIKNNENDIKSNNKDSEVEEISPSEFPMLNSHSKKISKK